MPHTPCTKRETMFIPFCQWVKEKLRKIEDELWPKLVDCDVDRPLSGFCLNPRPLTLETVEKLEIGEKSR